MVNGNGATKTKLALLSKLRARKEITSQSETARKLPRIDDRKSVHISNIDRLTIVDLRGFGAVSDAEVISLRALTERLSRDLSFLDRLKNKAKMTKCSQDTAYRDIMDLVDRGILSRNPESGRSTSYSLNCY